VTKYFEHIIYLGQKMLMLPVYETCSLYALPDGLCYDTQKYVLGVQNCFSAQYFRRFVVVITYILYS
jgi:hypothetical protein